MASSPASATPVPTEAPPKRKKLGTVYIVLVTVICLALIVLIKHTFLFILVALLPAIVAFIVDRSEHRSVFQSVMACNLAGMIYYLAKLVAGKNQASLVLSTMGDMTVWLVIYSAAGLGYGMVRFWPHIAYSLLQMLSLKEIVRLELAQRKLIEEWGPEIKRRD